MAKNDGDWLKELNAATSGAGGEIIQAVADHLAAHWKTIAKTIATAEDQRGNVAFSVKLSLAGKTPTGEVSIAYAARTKESIEFAVDDPEQEKLGL